MFTVILLQFIMYLHAVFNNMVIVNCLFSLHYFYLVVNIEWDFKEYDVFFFSVL